MDLSKRITILSIILLTLLVGAASFGSDFMFPFPDRPTPLTAALTGTSEVNSPPAKAYFPIGDSTSMSGETHSYTTEATDPDGDKVRYTFDWGDNTSSTTALVASGIALNASHNWTIEPGTVKIFSVRAKATDEHEIDGLWSNSLLVYVLAERLQRPPAIPSKPVGPTSGITGESYSYSTSSTDPDGDKIKYTFDWGDGFTETAFFPSGQTVNASHIWTYVPAGKTWNYSVNVDCSDSRSMPSLGISESLVVAITGRPVTTSSTTSTSTTRITTTTSSTSTTTSSTRRTTTSSTSSSTSSTRTTTTSTSSSSSTTLYKTGDANSDGHVDYEDLIILASSYGLFSTETGFDYRADFDDDGEIGYDDLILLASNYET